MMSSFVTVRLIFQQLAADSIVLKVCGTFGTVAQ